MSVLLPHHRDAKKLRARVNKLVDDAVTAFPVPSEMDEASGWVRALRLYAEQLRTKKSTSVKKKKADSDDEDSVDDEPIVYDDREMEVDTSLGGRASRRRLKEGRPRRLLRRPGTTTRRSTTAGATGARSRGALRWRRRPRRSRPSGRLKRSSDAALESEEEFDFEAPASPAAAAAPTPKRRRSGAASWWRTRTRATRPLPPLSRHLIHIPCAPPRTRRAARAGGRPARDRAPARCTGAASGSDTTRASPGPGARTSCRLRTCPAGTRRACAGSGGACPRRSARGTVQARRARPHTGRCRCSGGCTSPAFASRNGPSVSLNKPVTSSTPSRTGGVKVLVFLHLQMAARQCDVFCPWVRDAGSANPSI